MFDQYGRAVVQAYQEDRRLYEVKDYLRREYGSVDGIRPHLRRKNGVSKVRSGLRAILARITGAVAKPQIQASAPVTPSGRALSEERADRAVPQVDRHVVPQAGSVGYRGGLRGRPRSTLPNLKR